MIWVWPAYREPERFDSLIPNLATSEDDIRCLQKLSNSAFDGERDQLVNCSDLVTGSDRWNECIDEADRYRNLGVVLRDIAKALDGAERFDASPGGQFLIFSKTFAEDSGIDWRAFVDALEGCGFHPDHHLI